MSAIHYSSAESLSSDDQEHRSVEEMSMKAGTPAMRNSGCPPPSAPGHEERSRLIANSRQHQEHGLRFVLTINLLERKPRVKNISYDK